MKNLVSKILVSCMAFSISISALADQAQDAQQALTSFLNSSSKGPQADVQEASQILNVLYQDSVASALSTKDLGQLRSELQASASQANSNKDVNAKVQALSIAYNQFAEREISGIKRNRIVTGVVVGAVIGFVVLRITTTSSRYIVDGEPESIPHYLKRVFGFKYSGMEGRVALAVDAMYSGIGATIGGGGALTLNALLNEEPGSINIEDASLE